MFVVVKMDLDATRYGGRRRRVGLGHTVLDGNHPAPPTERNTAALPHFSAAKKYGQTVAHPRN